MPSNVPSCRINPACTVRAHTRACFRQHRFDYSSFLPHGITSVRFQSISDAMHDTAGFPIYPCEQSYLLAAVRILPPTNLIRMRWAVSLRCYIVDEIMNSIRLAASVMLC